MFNNPHTFNPGQQSHTPHYPLPPQPPRSNGGLWIILILLGGGFALLFAMGAMIFSAMTGNEPDFSGEARLGVIEIKGPIEDSKDAVTNLHRFAKDEKIKGILVRIDSPGGAVGPSQEIHKEILKVRVQKPVVISMGTIATSGGYYIACAGERIFANPGTLTGSIGVIIVSSYLEDLMKYLKIEMRTFKSGEHKDTLSPFRPMTDSDKALIDDIIKDIYEQFLTDVATSRKLDKETLRPLADGRMLTGHQALEAKLIDEYGNFRDAVSYLGKKVGLGEDPKLSYPPKDGLSRIEKLFESMARGTTKALSDTIKPSIEAQVKP